MSPELHPLIQEKYPFLNEDQLAAVSLTDGPLLIIAGPGSGKTLVLVIRTLNLMLLGKAHPEEIVLCTFTEKAANELRDRVSQAARTLGYTGDLSQLQVGTIHGLCNDYLMRYRHHTPLATGYEVLDDLTQPLFLFENFDHIIDGAVAERKYLGKWATKWTAIEGIVPFFNKITEELVDPSALIGTDSPFLQALGAAYQRYEALLLDLNRLDFAHQQKFFYDLLQDRSIADQIRGRARYIMVDEYQDTNYIQEQLILQLASATQNLCVVGDDDQSLYRFRGATVRNILEFGQHFEDCPQERLTTNYRSHRAIIEAYNLYMEGCDWSNPHSRFGFRYSKEIKEDPETEHPDYPSVFQIWGADKQDEATRVADLVAYLKENGVISDYNQVAVLLRSVREGRSAPYIAALQDRRIPTFAPRARTYFNNRGVKLIVACYALLLGWYDDNRGNLRGRGLDDLADYVDDAITELARAGVVHWHPLAEYLRSKVAQIESLQIGETLDERVADYLYEILAYEPFVRLLASENCARNLAMFSQLLAIFQHYYHYSVISHRNRGFVRLHFFNSFLRFLHIGGINEYEDPEQPFPSGYVQMMTIHQSKGLEFPVVIVGSLTVNIGTGKQVDRLLSPLYHRPRFEPMDRITEFDRMRLHYVAFSRAQKVLVLTTTDVPKAHFDPIWQGLPQWPYVQKELLVAQRFAPKEYVPAKKALSFTSHIKVYETCPRQYQLFREYGFAPSRSAEYFFGSLVHQTIEDIHRWVLDGRPLPDIEPDIPALFAANSRALINAGYRPISEEQRALALQQVNTYFSENQASMQRVIETEVDVSVEKDDYILVGKIDLLMGDDHKLELLDFKAQQRPPDGVPYLDTYHQQLLVYAHILQERYGREPERLALYWTGEPTRERALMYFPYQPERVSAAGAYFDEVAGRILAKDFAVRQRPERKVCLECDFREYCQAQGTIRLAG